MSGLAPAGCSLGLADTVPEPGSHLLGTAVQGKTGRGAENHSLMGGKSFEWPGARAPGVTVRSPSPFPRQGIARRLSLISPSNLQSRQPAEPACHPTEHSNLRKLCAEETKAFGDVLFSLPPHLLPLFISLPSSQHNTHTHTPPPTTTTVPPPQPQARVNSVNPSFPF